jgi:hypothetical protein
LCHAAESNDKYKVDDLLVNATLLLLRCRHRNDPGRHQFERVVCGRVPCLRPLLLLLLSLVVELRGLAKSETKSH